MVQDEHVIVASTKDGTGTESMASYMLLRVSIRPYHDGLVLEDLKADIRRHAKPVKPFFNSYSKSAKHVCIRSHFAITQFLEDFQACRIGKLFLGRQALKTF